MAWFSERINNSVSSSYLARVCALLNVPRPPRGYWAKLEAGKTSQRPELPDARPGDAVTWMHGGGLPPDTSLPSPVAPAATKPLYRLPRNHRKIHPLLDGLLAQFAGARELDNGLLKPRKVLMADILSSQALLDTTVRTASELYLALEANGHLVRLAPSDQRLARESVDERDHGKGRECYPNVWHPMRPTVVYIGTVAIGLTLLELTEEIDVKYVNGKYIPVRDIVAPKKPIRDDPYSWTSQKSVPTGRLRLQAYSPYYKADWKETWTSSATTPLADLVPQIVRTLEAVAPRIAELAAEGRRIAEQEHQRWQEELRQLRIAEEARKRAQCLSNSREQLLKIVEAWDIARQIEEFFVDAERRIAMNAAGEQSALLGRLQSARKILGENNALKKLYQWKSTEEIYQETWPSKD